MSGGGGGRDAHAARAAAQQATQKMIISAGNEKNCHDDWPLYYASMWKKATVFTLTASEALLLALRRPKDQGNHDYCLPSLHHALRCSR